jgi:hypothetical protein
MGFSTQTLPVKFWLGTEPSPPQAVVVAMLSAMQDLHRHGPFLREELRRRGWKEADLPGWRKGDKVKAALARRLCRAHDSIH